MSENLPDLVTVQNEIVEAQQAGDQRAANLAYAKELEIRSKPPQEKKADVPATTEKAEDHLYRSGLVTDAELRALGELESDKDVVALSELVGSVVKQLNKTGRTIQIDQVVGTEKVAKFLEGFTNDEVRELTAAVVSLPRALTLASGFLKIAIKYRPALEVPDDFKFWKVALPVVERIYARYNQAASAAPLTAPANVGARDEYLDTLHAFEERMAELQARGLNRDANRVYREQQEWIASQQGDQRIVGSSGRYA